MAYAYGGGYGAPILGAGGGRRVNTPTTTVDASQQAPTKPQGYDPNDPRTWSPEEQSQFYGGIYSASGGYSSGSPTSANYDPRTGTAMAPTYGAAPTGPDPTTIQRSDYTLPYGQDIMGALRARAGDVLGRSQDTDVRQQQMALAGMLQRYATGQDSASALQLRSAADQNIANQMAMAASARPGGAQLAALNAAQNAGTINTQLAGQSALAGLQERTAAQNALGQVLGATRGQDLQFGQQNDSAYQQALAQQLATAQLMQQGGMGYSQAVAAQELGRQQLATQLQLASMNRPSDFWSTIKGLTQLGGVYATMGNRPGGTPATDSSFAGVGNTGAPY